MRKNQVYVRGIITNHKPFRSNWLKHIIIFSLAAITTVAVAIALS